MHTATFLTAVLSVLALTDAAPTPGGYNAVLKQDKHKNRDLHPRGKAFNLAIKQDGGRIPNAHEAREIAAANTHHVRSRYDERAPEAETR